jgi:hypothetical protein
MVGAGMFVKGVDRSIRLQKGGVEKKGTRCELKAKLSGRVVNKRKQVRLKEAGTGVLSRRE